MLRRRKSKNRGAGGNSPARAVGSIADAAMRVFMTADGRIRFETILSAVAATAGTKVLRAHAGPALREAEAGTAIFSDGAHAAMLDLGKMVESRAASMGIPWPVGLTEIPPQHQPQQTYVELVRLLEPSVDATLSSVGASDRSPESVAFATLELVQRAGPIVPFDLVPLLVMSGLVAGAKTVPHDVRW